MLEATMKKTLLLAAALMVVTATMASAQRGSLTLGWGNCRVNGGGLSNASFACTINTGNGPLLVGGYIPGPTANLNSINSAFLYVDIYQLGVSLDPWWQLTDPPVTGCRALSVWSLDMANAAAVTCDRSYWADVGNPVQAARYFYPTYMSNHATFRMLVAVDASVAETTPQIGATEESHVFGARLGRANSTGAGSCAGCLNAANLYFGQADFFQTNGDNFVIDGVPPTSPTNHPVPGPKCVTWQNAAGPACPTDVTPARNATWGSIKSMYR
jgi:hypothetical protein